MPLLPAPHDDPDGWLSSRQADKAKRARDRTELAIYQYALRAHAQSEFDRLDSQAVADSAQAALETELDLLDYGLRRAGQSAARIELVARKTELLATINSRRLARRFGA